MLTSFQRIMFQREFNVIASAGNAELLRKKLKIDELERYGEPFSPDFIYDAIRKLPRFASMRVRINAPAPAQLFGIANVRFYSAAISKTRRNSSASSLRVCTMNVLR